MKRIDPEDVYRGKACSIVAVGTALGLNTSEQLRKFSPHCLKADGYLSLDGMNCFVRSHLQVAKREYFKRGERPILRDFLRENKRKAIICLYGHYVYANGTRYYSFLRNGDDPVVCVWWLKE